MSNKEIHDCNECGKPGKYLRARDGTYFIECCGYVSWSYSYPKMEKDWNKQNPLITLNK